MLPESQTCFAPRTLDCKHWGNASSEVRQLKTDDFGSHKRFYERLSKLKRLAYKKKDLSGGYQLTPLGTAINKGFLTLREISNFPSVITQQQQQSAYAHPDLFDPGAPISEVTRRFSFSIKCDLQYSISISRSSSL